MNNSLKKFKSLSGPIHFEIFYFFLSLNLQWKKIFHIWCNGWQARQVISSLIGCLIHMYQIKAKSLINYCFILTFWPGQKCHSKVMHRKEVTHSNGSYERKSRGRKLADEMGRAKKKFPWYTHRLMHRKRVTSELHDSYFRLMTIKHSISKIEWASNDYITQLSSTSQLSCSQLETRGGRKSHTHPRGPSGTPMEFEVQRRCW